MCERARAGEGVSVRWNEAPVLPGLWLKSTGFGANTARERATLGGKTNCKIVHDLNIQTDETLPRAPSCAGANENKRFFRKVTQTYSASRSTSNCRASLSFLLDRQTDNDLIKDWMVQ